MIPAGRASLPAKVTAGTETHPPVHLSQNVTASAVVIAKFVVDGSSV